MKAMILMKLTVLLSLIAWQSVALAQGQYRYSDDAYSEDRIIVYEHCDFRGASSVVEPGIYQSMRDIRFGNDKMSSIRVPEGLEVRIFEDDNFRGAYANINRDISCFDRSWNDKVSSMQVYVDQNYSSNRYRSERNRDRSADNRNGWSQRNGNRYGGRYGDGANNTNVTAANVSAVSFGGSQLQQVAKRQWRLESSQAGRLQFKETSRDGNSVYLQNQYTGERIRIDMFANEVVMVNREGYSQRYRITDKQAAVSSNQNRANPRVAQNQSTPKVLRFNKSCFNYKAWTTGGQGGLRIYGHLKFKQFNRKPISGRFCHSGEATLELQKNRENTDVYLQIDNTTYRFAPGEDYDVLKNTWFRRKTQLLMN